MDSSTFQGKEWEQSGECRSFLPPSLMSGSFHMECSEKREPGSRLSVTFSVMRAGSQRQCGF